MQCKSLEYHLERFLRTKHNEGTRTWYRNYLQPLDAILRTRCQTLRYFARGGRAEDYWHYRAFLAVTVGKSTPTNRPCNGASHPRHWATTCEPQEASGVPWLRQQVVAQNVFDHLTAPKDNRRGADEGNHTPTISRRSGTPLDNPASADYAIITVVATCGLRAGELISMNLHQLELKQGIAWVDGKRGWRKIFLGPGQHRCNL